MANKLTEGKGICPHCGTVVKFGVKSFGVPSPSCPNCGSVVLNWLDGDYNVHIHVAGGTGAGKSPREYKKGEENDD